MRALPFLLVICIMMSAPTPAGAQRFGGNDPVCLQQWKRGGVSWISCRYGSWEQCQAETVGLAAMCLLNPYAQRPPHPDRGPRPR
ncbi:DUF3551 domain-containing protein [Bradyrhizobium sp. Gha]|uniref:DUF3551 domain-containing protein n=1 Tax=Bradyrhizobium sp. Gha TaxID=1855318 RepID=UPI0008EB17C7|nr:DUF3551 domain-containing protein [Bradyrhizobium sp. Gha]SFJ66238.1 Protein of unknown function [Bradyrhizobium sp. Gha]